MQVEDTSLLLPELHLLTFCMHGVNNPCINPAEGPAFGHRAVIVRGCQKHHASLGWGREHVDLLMLAWGKTCHPPWT